MAASLLSSPKLRALQAVNDALLDPLSHDTTESWLLDVCARFKTLCGGQATWGYFRFRDAEARWISCELPQKYADIMAEIEWSPSGETGRPDRYVGALVHGLRQRKMGIGTTADLLDQLQLREDNLQEAPTFRDVAFPTNLPGSALLFHAGASGEVGVQTSYPEIRRRPFNEATQEILSPLLPALAASFGALGRLGDARRAVAALLDALDDGAVVFDPAGKRILAANHAVSALRRTEGEAAGLDQAILRAALAAAWPTAATKSAPASDPWALSRAWRSPTGASYRLRAVRLPSGSLSVGEAILVLVQRVGPPIPDETVLMRRFGLTRREADVAYRLAYGRSNREIAAELGVSPHTVRHHSEAVFLKLGVVSRKALALHLAANFKEGP